MRFTFLNLTASSTSTHTTVCKDRLLHVTRARTYYWSRQRLVTTLRYPTKAKSKPNSFNIYSLNLQINYKTQGCFTYLPKLARHSNLAVRLPLHTNELRAAVAIQFQEFNLSNLFIRYSRFLKTNFTLCKLLLRLTNLKSSFHGIDSTLSKLLRPKTESVLVLISTRLI